MTGTSKDILIVDDSPTTLARGLYSNLSKSELSRLTQECAADGFICKENPGDLLPEVRRLLGENRPTPAERPETSEPVWAAGGRE